MTPTVTFFFVQDFRKKYRFLSAEPARRIPVEFNRTKKIWEEAKTRLLLLPQRVIRQEQALGKGIKLTSGSIDILYSGLLTQRDIQKKFRFLLYRQRTRHILYLIAETVVLPLAGIAGILPGPNVAFYFLLLLMVLHGQALRGIRRILKNKWHFRPSPLLSRWERAVAEGREDRYPSLLKKIKDKYGIEKIHKILWK